MPSLDRTNRAFGLRVQELNQIITHVELTTAGAQQAIDYSDALPDNAMVIAVYADITEAFIDAGVGTLTADLGIKSGDTDAFLDAVDLTTAIDKLSIPRGAALPGWYGGETPTMIFDGSVNVDTFTAGSVEFHILFVDPTDIG